MSKKTKTAYEGQKLMYAFVGESCPDVDVSNPQEQYEDYKKSLDEINAMICHFKDIRNDEEVAYFRRMAMHVKMCMRELKEKIIEANNMTKEIAYS